MKFYTTPAIPITSVGSTTTIEKSITVGPDSSVIISFFAPTWIAGYRVYRGAQDSELLIAEVPFNDSTSVTYNNTVLVTFTDSGLPQGVDTYPLTNILNSLEQFAIPDPDFDLQEGTEGTLSGTYYYRVAFYTKPNIGFTFTTEIVETRFYYPDLSTVCVSSMSDLSPDFTEITDLFDFLEDFIGELDITQKPFLNTVSSFQELVFNNSIVQKIVAPKIQVEIVLDSQLVIENKPVILNVSPNNIEIEVIENAFVGPYKYLKGASTKVFSGLGTIQYFLSERARILFIMSNTSFRVV